MLGYRRQMLGLRALAICTVVTTGSIADHASAQYCDDRYREPGLESKASIVLF